jgi:hypothetical protein
MPVNLAFFVLLLQATLSLSLTSSRTNPLPFQHVRKPIFAPLPIDKHGSITDQPSRPAFQPGKAYTYKLALNTTSELYSYNYQHDSDTGSGIADADSSGFSAAVASNLTILTQADSPEPGTLIFLAYVSVPDCLVEAGNPIRESGLRVIRNTFGTDQDCVKQSEGVDNQTRYSSQNYSFNCSGI